MLPSRFAPPGQQSANRTSRLETQRPSMLPKPRRPGSTDRLSSEARRPSASGHRSSSAEPARGTFGGGRLSREASATKVPMNGRSRSQQSEKFRQTSMTPLRSSHFSRPTTTPVRSPSVDRGKRNWQTSLERALAFVTIKDQRPISSVAWQRAEVARVGEALAGRGEGGGMALIRPLTIARFVDITAALVTAIAWDARLLNTDNYVTKLPHLSKRLLYPGTVSKSWLKTVNTLHAFPNALALIAYLLDLANMIEMPVSDDWLYVAKDEVACYRRDYLFKCWIRFQDPGHHFEDLNEEYLQNLRLVFGNNEAKITELSQVIKKYEARLNDEEEVAAREADARLAARRDSLLSAIRCARAARLDARAGAEQQAARRRDLALACQQLALELERVNVDIQQLKVELESQPMTVEERTKLLGDVEYAVRVQESKRILADQIAKMVQSKETELAAWQEKTLDSCVQYKQGLIHLSAQFQDLASLAIDEKELMSAECSAAVVCALDVLRARSAALAQQRSEHARERSALSRRRAALLEESRTKIGELKSAVQREQEALDMESSKEALDAAAAAAELRSVSERLQELKLQQDELARADSELRFWERQDQLWRARLQALQQHITAERLEVQRVLDVAKQKRAKLLLGYIRDWNEKLHQLH